MRVRGALQEVYEYHPVSTFYDLEPLRRLHPIIELHEYLAASDARVVDVLFALRRGMPPQKHMANDLWVVDECNAKDGTADVIHETRCEVRGPTRPRTRLRTALSSEA